MSDLRKPISITALLDALERRAAQRLRDAACRQRFDGRLSVDPSRVYIDRATGQRALRQCRALLTARPG